MSAHILLNLLNELGKSDKMRGFVCNEELKGSMQCYSLCLLGNQLKFQLQPFGCKRARAPIT